MINDVERILVDEKEIKEIVARIGAQIKEDYKDSKKLVMVCILKGSVVFFADLIREIDLPMQIEFMRASSYGSGTETSGVINVSLDLPYEDLSGYDIIVVEDIVDSGRTLKHLMNYLSLRNANSVKLCALLDKPDRRQVEIKVDYEGKKIPDEFVIGYGLDYDEKYRNLPYVGILKREIYE